MWWGWIALGAVTIAVNVMDRRLARYGRPAVAVGMSLLVALAFGAVVAAVSGADQAGAYLAAYAAERVLSVDNVVALLAVVAAFGLPAADKDRVFVWGVNAALVLRTGMVLAGVGLVEAFWWSEPVLGALLAAGGVHIARQRHTAAGGTGVAGRLGGRRPLGGSSALVVAVVAVVATDAVFALDSVPTVVAFAREPFPAVSAAALSVLGLRPLGELIGDWVIRLRYLQPAMGTILLVVGVKLALTPVLVVSDVVLLGVVVVVLFAGIAASLIRPTGSTAATLTADAPVTAGKE